MMLVGPAQNLNPIRRIEQNGSTWEVTYKNIENKDIHIELSAQVSNSAVPGHSKPFDLNIKDSKPIKICDSCNIITNVSYGVNSVTIKMIHDHNPYGKYQPLLGKFHINIKNKQGLVYQDDFTLDKCKTVHDLPWKFDLEKPKSWRGNSLAESKLEKAYLDDRMKGSIYISSDSDRHRRFEIEEIPVKYSTRKKISFWYILDLDNNLNTSFIVKEYKTDNQSNNWEGSYRTMLSKYRGWHRFEYILKTKADTASLDLLFGLEYVDMNNFDDGFGHAWFRDFKIENVDGDNNDL
jgi:hypothetical protein